jgi:uncharacterized protein (DUF1499 family)
MSSRKPWVLAAAVLATITLFLFIASVFTIRMNPILFQRGFSIYRWATLSGAAGIFVALTDLVLAIREKDISRRVLPPVIAIAVCLPIFISGQQMKMRQEKLPKIHDVTTDTEDPPQFSALVPVRQQEAANPIAYAGEKVAKQQLKAYPDLKPLIVNQPIFETTQRALSVVEVLDWEVVSLNPAKGIIEATATTPIFGFREDVVIRLKSEEQNKTRIDVRSVSRVGDTDYGSNADRIRFYLNRLEKRLK